MKTLDLKSRVLKLKSRVLSTTPTQVINKATRGRWRFNCWVFKIVALILNGTIIRWKKSKSLHTPIHCLCQIRHGAHLGESHTRRYDGSLLVGSGSTDERPQLWFSAEEPSFQRTKASSIRPKIETTVEKKRQHYSRRWEDYSQYSLALKPLRVRPVHYHCELDWYSTFQDDRSHEQALTLYNQNTYFDHPFGKKNETVQNIWCTLEVKTDVKWNTKLLMSDTGGCVLRNQSFWTRAWPRGVNFQSLTSCNCSFA